MAAGAIIVNMRLVLASGSPRRADLLTAAGFVFETIAVDVDEHLRPHEPPEVYVRRLAQEKSAAALELVRRQTVQPLVDTALGQRDDLVVLGADTAVVVDGLVLGKPPDEDAARTMLRRLSGRAHDVLTGLSVRHGAIEAGRVERTRVWFSPMTQAQIDWYAGTDEGRDKAGAYAVQGLASRFIPRIEGSYSNVVGLPVQAVEELLAGFWARP